MSGAGTDGLLLCRQGLELQVAASAEGLEHLEADPECPEPAGGPGLGRFRRDPACLEADLECLEPAHDPERRALYPQDLALLERGPEWAPQA